MSEQQPAAVQQPEPTQDEGKKFDQSEVDRIVSERLKREREKFGDVEELRRKAKDYDSLQEAQKSELQKAADAASREKERADRLEEGLRQERVRNAVTTAAVKADFHDPEDAYRLLDASDIELDDAGTPRNLDKLLSSLAKAKPHLVKSGPGNGSGDGGPRGGTTNTKSPGETFGDLIAERLGR